MQETKWLACPICDGKTRIQVREDTMLLNFPLYCPKCKKETLINFQKNIISVIIEPDAQTQSR
ncbi:MAG: cysteine-rich KTR domain-containing protein [Oscillibacter sp.]|nr:cysteine-rich KTR domain-containing protein [Oscillibacter sp.]